MKNKAEDTLTNFRETNIISFSWYKFRFSCLVIIILILCTHFLGVKSCREIKLCSQEMA